MLLRLQLANFDVAEPDRVAMVLQDNMALALLAKSGISRYLLAATSTSSQIQQAVVEFPSFSMEWEHMIGCGVGPWQREHGVEFHGENGILVVDRSGWEVYSETE